MPGILYKDTTLSDKAAQEPIKEEAKEDESINNSASVDLSVEIEKIEKEIQELAFESSSASADDQQSSVELIIEDKEELVEETSGNSLTVSQQQQTGSGSSAPTSLTGANFKALMDSFVSQLPNCVNRELIDKAAKEFCLNLNTKLNRKRLVRALFEVQRTRLDLLPFYSRFVAILSPIMPELSTELSSYLINDFRFHVRKKDQINIESKIKSARFIGELVKFNMFSKFEALNCLKTLLADFRHHNIEMFCNLLDVCGRFLYRNVETHMKLKLFLVGNLKFRLNSLKENF